MTIELVGGSQDGRILHVGDSCRGYPVDSRPHPKGPTLRRMYYWTPHKSSKWHQVFLYHSAVEVVS